MKSVLLLCLLHLTFAQWEGMAGLTCEYLMCPTGQSCMMVRTNEPCEPETCIEVPACVAMPESASPHDGQQPLPGPDFAQSDMYGAYDTEQYGAQPDYYDDMSEQYGFPQDGYYPQAPAQEEYYSQLPQGGYLQPPPPLPASAMDACYGVMCLPPKTCVSGVCRCNIQCHAVPDMEVCGTDGVKYPNECEMNKASCESGQPITITDDMLCMRDVGNVEEEKRTRGLTNVLPQSALSFLMKIAKQNKDTGSDQCRCWTWTRWMNSDKDLTNGDHETLNFANNNIGNVHSKFPEACHSPLSVEVRRASDRTPWQLTNDKVSPPGITGFKCDGTECSDYEIRLLCPDLDCAQCFYWSEWYEVTNTDNDGIKTDAPCKGNQIPIDVECVTRDGHVAISQASLSDDDATERSLDVVNGCRCKGCADKYQVRYLCPLLP